MGFNSGFKGLMLQPPGLNIMAYATCGMYSDKPLLPQAMSLHFISIKACLNANKCLQ